jgi:aminocarboxymuconate-semialdehyde decarboxylase
MNVRLSCRCGIDTHTHVVPGAFPAYAGRLANVRWPSMVDAQPCHRHVMLAGNIYRTVSKQCWDVDVRLGDMQAQSVERQVLSPMPELLAYWLEAEDGQVLARFLNETLASMVSAAPQRFSALGAVPLQDVDLSIRELELSMREFGLAGVEIGSNINGVPIGDPRFLPFFEAARELGAAIFVHALRPAGMDRLVGPPALEQTVAFPAEIGLAAMSMITGGTMAKLPGLRIAFSHGGGALRVQVPRLEHAWQNFGLLRDQLPEGPTAVARAMYFDNLLYDRGAILSLIELVGDRRVMVGTDYPFAIMDKDPAGRLDSLALAMDVRERLSRLNALDWLGL